MMSLSGDKQADIIEAFNTRKKWMMFQTFDNTVSQIYGNPSELQLNKANTFDTKASFLYLHLSISNDVVSTKIGDKHDDFNLEIVRWWCSSLYIL